MEVYLLNKKIENFFDFNDVNILILGGNSGLGFEMVKSFSNFNNEIYITGRDIKKIRKSKSYISKNYNKTIHTFQTNFVSEDSVINFFKNFKKKCNSINILINCIGYNQRNLIENISSNEWENILKTNLSIPFYISKHSLPFLKRSKFGRLINLTSIFSSVSFPERTSYSSSKGGLLMLTKTLALEWAKYKITVNSISPGPFLTDINLPLLNNRKKYSEFCKNIPLGRFGNPNEIITSVLFLASRNSDYVTGSNIHVDGGWTSK